MSCDLAKYLAQMDVERDMVLRERQARQCAEQLKEEADLFWADNAGSESEVSNNWLTRLAFGKSARARRKSQWRPQSLSVMVLQASPRA